MSRTQDRATQVLTLSSVVLGCTRQDSTRRASWQGHEVLRCLATTAWCHWSVTYWLGDRDLAIWGTCWITWFCGKLYHGGGCRVIAALLIQQTWAHLIDLLLIALIRGVIIPSISLLATSYQLLGNLLKMMGLMWLMVSIAGCCQTLKDRASRRDYHIRLLLMLQFRSWAWLILIMLLVVVSLTLMASLSLRHDMLLCILLMMVLQLGSRYHPTCNRLICSYCSMMIVGHE